MRNPELLKKVRDHALALAESIDEVLKQAGTVDIHDELLTTYEVAQMFGWDSTAQVRRACAAGCIPGVKRHDTAKADNKYVYLIPRSGAEAWRAEGFPGRNATKDKDDEEAGE